MKSNQVLLTLGLLFISLCSVVIAAPTLSHAPQNVSKSNELLTVSWSDVTNITPGDVIVMYYLDTKPDAFPVPDVPNRKTLGYYSVLEYDPQKTGKGSIQFPAFLPRDHFFYFEYLRVEKKVSTVIAYDPVLAADSNKITCTQFHLATTHTPNQMLIQYTTSDPAEVQHNVQVWPLEDAELVKNNFIYHTVGDSDGYFLANDTNLSYTIKDMFESPANDPKFFTSPGRFREALIHGLEPNKRYGYRVLPKEDKTGGSQTFSFTSPPLPGQGDTNMFVFGDLGVAMPFYTVVQQQSPSIKTTENIARHLKETPDKHTSVLLIGDLSYARGYAWMWEYFFQQIEPIAASSPLHVTIGNHEYDWPKQPWKPSWSDFKQDSGGEGGRPTFARFRSPDDFHATPYNTKSWYTDAQTKDYKSRGERSISYSYDTGYVHVVVFSAEHDFTTGSAQYNFIEADLKAVDRKKTPWVIVAAHRPMYCTSSDCSIDKNVEAKKMDWYIRTYLQPLMNQYKVNVVFSGHNHHYERSCLIQEGYKCVDDENTTKVVNGVTVSKSIAPLYILTGASGNPYEPQYQPFNPMVPDSIPIVHHVTPEWCVFRTMAFGYSHVHANATHFTQTFYGNQRYGLIHDRVVLTDPY